MRNQTTRKQTIQEQVFNEVTIYRASQIYKKYIEHGLKELKKAMDGCRYAEADRLKVELQHLSRNLTELGDVQDLTERMGEVERITAPANTADIQSRINVLTPKNVEKALAVYRGYVDVYLDVLFSAMTAENHQQVNEVKVELECLRKNIQDLEGANIQ